MSKKEGSQDTSSVESLVKSLGSKDGRVRETARHGLVAKGTEAVDVVTSALKASTDKQTRWEATKVLAEIHDPATTPGLVSSLSAEESDIRWIAAGGLIALRRGGLRLVLEALADEPGCAHRRQGTHHVVKELASGDLEQPLKRVLSALESSATDEEVPLAIAAALRELDG